MYVCLPLCLTVNAACLDFSWVPLSAWKPCLTSPVQLLSVRLFIKPITTMHLHTVYKYLITTNLDNFPGHIPLAILNPASKEKLQVIYHCSPSTYRVLAFEVWSSYLCAKTLYLISHHLSSFIYKHVFNTIWEEHKQKNRKTWIKIIYLVKLFFRC